MNEPQPVRKKKFGAGSKNTVMDWHDWGAKTPISPDLAITII